MQEDHPYPLWKASHTKPRKLGTLCKSICRATLKFIGRKLSETVPFTYKVLHLLPQRRTINIFDDPPSIVSRVFRQFCRDCCRTIARYGKIRTTIDRHVVFKAKRDFSMTLDVNEYTQCGYYFAPPNRELIDHIMKGGDTFVDIGAYVGFFSLLGSQYFREVLSFEPTPKTFNRLQANVTASNIENISLFNIAISDRSGEVILYENPYNIGGNSLEGFSKECVDNSKRDDWFTYKVRSMSLDEVMENFHPVKIQLIKIDVEGHELKVLNGARKTLMVHKPVLFVEIGKNEQKLVDIMSILPDFYQPYNLILMSRIVEQQKIPVDVFFLPKKSIMSFK